MPSPINAVEIAVLVRGMKNITEAAALIDQYAAMVAAGARLDALSKARDRLTGALPPTQESSNG